MNRRTRVGSYQGLEWGVTKDYSGELPRNRVGVTKE